MEGVGGMRGTSRRIAMVSWLMMLIRREGRCWSYKMSRSEGRFFFKHVGCTLPAFTLSFTEIRLSGRARVCKMRRP